MSYFIEWSVWSLTLFIEVRLLVLLGCKQVMWMQYCNIAHKIVYPHVLWYIWGINTLQIKYVIISQIYDKVSTIFHTWKVLVGLVCDNFDVCKVKGECPLDCNLFSIILHSFLFMSFSLGVSHIKVFNEAISIQGYMSYLLFFSTGVFLEEDMQDILKMCIAL